MGARRLAPAVKRLALAGMAALVTACMMRMPMPMPRMEMPTMPEEGEIREMVDRQMGKPTLPDQPDARTVQVVFQTGHAGAISAVALSRDGRYIASAAWDETAKLWDVASGQEVRTFTGVDQFTDTISFVGETRRIALGSMMSGKLIDGDTGRAVATLDRLSVAVISARGLHAARTAGSGLPADRRAQRAAEGISIVELATDRIVATLPTDAMTQPLAVSDDGRTLIVQRMEQDNDRAMEAARAGRAWMPPVHVEVWDVATRKRRNELPVAMVGSSNSALSADGSAFAIESIDQKVSVYDVATGALRQTLAGGSKAERYSMGHTLLFSSDGKWLARATQGGRVRLWQMPEGRLAHEFEGTAVNFSADGRQLVAGKAGGGAPFLRDLESGTERSLVGGASAISDLALVGDGSSVVAATEGAGARFWNLASGELIRTFACPGGGSVYSVSVSSTARWLATGCMDGAAHVWNLDTGAVLRTFLQPRTEQIGPMPIVRFDRSGRRLAVGRGNDLAVWEVAENRELRRLTLPDGPMPAFTDPAQMYETMDNVPEAQRAAMKEMTSDPAYLRAQQAIRTFELHPDGVHAAVSKGWTLSLWNISTGASVREFSLAASRALEAKQPQPAAGGAQGVSQQDLLAKLMSGKRMSKSDMKALQELQKGGQMGVMVRTPGEADDEMLEAAAGGSLTMSLAFSRDGTRLHTLGATGPQAWEVATGRRIRVESANAPNPFDPESFMRQMEEREVGVGHGLALSPDGRYGARGFGRMLKIFDLATGDVVAELLGHTSDVSSVAYVQGGRLLVSGGRDGSVRVWSTRDGREAVQLLAFGAADYVAVTPDQFYRTSRRGIGGVAFRVGGKLYPFEQFDLRFNRPDVVLERLGGTPPAVVQGYRAAYLRRLKKLGFTEDMLGSELHLPEIELTGQVPVSTDAATLDLQIRAADAKYPLDRVNVFVNDVPVFGTAGLPLANRQAQQHEQNIRLPLVAGRNKVQVSVLNQQGAESLRQTAYTTSTAPATIPDVYVVAIGVSRYQRQAYNLRFAAKDATDLTSAYRSLAQRPGSVGDVHVLELTDAKATRTSIRQARGWLEQARVSDLVVLFAAGHGMTDAASNYYFGTYDIDPEQPASAGLPYEEFEALLDGIPAMQKLMLIDTCFSGEIEKDEPTAVAQVDTGGAGVVQMRAFKTARAINVVADAAAGVAQAGVAPADVVRFQQELFADLRRGTGAVVISSASGNEYALEGEQWANGVFTYALLDGLKNGSADVNRDQVISVSELQAHVLDQVRRLTAGGQNPTVRRENLEYDFRVY